MYIYLYESYIFCQWFGPYTTYFTMFAYTRLFLSLLNDFNKCYNKMKYYYNSSGSEVK